MINHKHTDNYKIIFSKLEEIIKLINYTVSLQMTYLSKKIVEDKQIDLTQPKYNPNVLKKLYKYRGSM